MEQQATARSLRVSPPKPRPLRPGIEWIVGGRVEAMDKLNKWYFITHQTVLPFQIFKHVFTVFRMLVIVKSTN
jgi:hypothetical protein